MRTALKRLKITVKWLTLATSVALALAPEWPAFGAERHQLNLLVDGRQFDFVVWWVEAAIDKATADLTQGQAYLTPESRRDSVMRYLALMGDVRRLEGEIQAVYSDPAVADAAAASAPERAALAEARAELDRLQPVAEAVLEEQVGALLVEEGFEVFGQVWPPVKMRMTPLPLVLIVSPREEIKQQFNVPLVPGLTIPDRQRLEDAVITDLERSALVVPIGGLGIFPAMILETANINFLADTIAHEWAHHWLTLHPLGLSYNANPDLRTINETVASIVGTEIGRQVIERYYPAHLPTPAPAPPPTPSPAVEPAFDFRAEMAATRIQVDALLAAGEVDQAEAYMEERRQMFVAEGYNIRRLNQAYFAFYGAYADTGGATGQDPVGPAVLQVRARADSLGSFMRQMSGVTNVEELLRLAGNED
jgi:hypothetical protein